MHKQIGESVSVLNLSMGTIKKLLLLNHKNLGKLLDPNGRL